MWLDIQNVVRYDTRDKRRGDVLDMGIVLMWACSRCVDVPRQNIWGDHLDQL